MNNKAIANIHSPVLIVGPEDLNQVPWLWFLIVLFEQMFAKHLLRKKDLATALMKKKQSRTSTSLAGGGVNHLRGVL